MASGIIASDRNGLVLGSDSSCQALAGSTHLNTRADSSQPSLLVDMLLAQAEANPGALAVVGSDGQLSFESLVRLASWTSSFLRAQLGRSATCIGLYAQGTTQEIVGVWGILFAGCAYVPLSSDYPPARLQFMAQATDVKIVFSEEGKEEEARLLLGSEIHVFTLRDVTQFVEANTISAVAAERTPESASTLAYVVFTSGSTGTPKGVMIEHASISNQMTWLSRFGVLSPSDVLLHKTPISFDAAQWEMLANCTGARVIVGSVGIGRNLSVLIRTIREHDVTVLQCVPTLLQALVEHDNFANCGSLRHVLSGAESLTRRLAERCADALPNCALVNVYGPAECTINATACRVTRSLLTSDIQSVPIGQAVDGVRCFVLDELLAPVPSGCTGEIYLSGIQLARGYVGSTSLTDDRFIHAALEGEVIRVYRTGDHARVNEDGSVTFIGRKDGQVKIRGMRVEIEEVRLALEQCAGVKQAAVIVTDAGERRAGKIVAFVAQDSARTVGVPIDNAATIRRQISEQLPSFMIPSEIRLVDHIPVTVTGKIDSESLRRQCARPIQDDHRPASDTEEIVRTLLRGILGAENIPLDTSFIDLGGDSIAAVSLALQIEDRFGCTLAPDLITETSTVADLAKAIEEHGRGAPSRVVPLVTGISGRPIFMWSGLGGLPLQLKGLAEKISAHRSSYSVRTYGLGQDESPLSCVREMAAWDIREIRDLQPSGPYTLLGYSLGAHVALEVASQLEIAGATVDKLILVAPGQPAYPGFIAFERINEKMRFSEPGFLAVLHAVFFRCVAHSAIQEFLKTVHDEDSFISSIRRAYPHFTQSYIKSIVAAVFAVYNSEIVQSEVGVAAPISADTLVIKADDDSYSHLESSRLYSRAGPRILECHADHFSILDASTTSDIAKNIGSFLDSPHVHGD